MNCCHGQRKRVWKTKVSEEKSVIDFIFLSEELSHEVTSVVIDEQREHVLTKIVKTKNGVKKVESDHNIIITKLNIKFNASDKLPKVELYDLKNKKSQEIFKEQTSTDINKEYLSKIFREYEDLDEASDIFLNRVQKIVKKCFNKVRIKDGKVNQEKEKL